MRQRSGYRASVAMASVALGLWLSGTARSQTIMLEDPAAIAHANAVSTAIGRISDAVMACRDAGQGTAPECLCRNADLVADLERTYTAAMARHPEWRDRIVFYTLEDGPTGHNIAFVGVRRQIETGACPGRP